MHVHMYLSLSLPPSFSLSPPSPPRAVYNFVTAHWRNPVYAYLFCFAACTGIIKSLCTHRGLAIRKSVSKWRGSTRGACTYPHTYARACTHTKSSQQTVVLCLHWSKTHNTGRLKKRILSQIARIFFAKRLTLWDPFPQTSIFGPLFTQKICLWSSFGKETHR